jgi:hypothetical protein
MRKEKMMPTEEGTNEMENTEATSEADSVSEGEEGTAGTESGQSESTSDTDYEAQGKPEWMSDRVWSENFADKGELNMEEVAQFYSKSYENAVNSLHNRKEVLRDEITQEIKDQIKANVPESSNDYEFDGTSFEEAYGLAVNMEPDDPALIQAKTWAFEHGLSQEDFNEMMNLHMQAVTTFFPDWDKESEALGEFADERANHLNSWLSKVLSTESYKAMEQLPLSAGVVVALEELMELSGNIRFSSESGRPAGTGFSRDDVMAMMDTDEYRRGDPAMVQKVQAGWKKIARS